MNTNVLPLSVLQNIAVTLGVFKHCRTLGLRTCFSFLVRYGDEGSFHLPEKEKKRKNEVENKRDSLRSTYIPRLLVSTYKATQFFFVFCFLFFLVMISVFGTSFFLSLSPKVGKPGGKRLEGGEGIDFFFCCCCCCFPLPNSPLCFCSLSLSLFVCVCVRYVFDRKETKRKFRYLSIFFFCFFVFFIFFFSRSCLSRMFRFNLLEIEIEFVWGVEVPSDNKGHKLRIFGVKGVITCFLEACFTVKVEMCVYR